MLLRHPTCRVPRASLPDPAMNLRPLLVVALALSSLGAVAALRHPAPQATGPYVELPTLVAIEVAPIPPLVDERVHTIRSGDTLGRILPTYGAPTDLVRDAALSLYDLAKLREGRDLVFVYHDGGAVPVEVRYALDIDHTLVVTREGEAWTARMDAIEYEAQPGYRDLVVSSSLWQAAIDAGLRPADIAALAAVFEYDIDFNTEVQAGARARMVIDELWTDGAFARLGSPQAVRFENGGKTYTAIRYTRADGTAGYYDEEGMARKKAFLRSPLAFSNVTSGFNLKRYHPILKKSRPHYGTDFGAPTGTPIRAVGEGVVSYAGRSGGHGNFVKIDHPGPYDSSYSHLSSISVKNGAHVRQGEIIGKVGSTGLATGPHLHFQFWVNGKYVNPMSVALPRVEPLPESELAAFQAERDRLLALLDSEALLAAVADGEDLDTGDRAN